MGTLGANERSGIAQPESIRQTAASDKIRNTFAMLDILFSSVFRNSATNALRSAERRGKAGSVDPTGSGSRNRGLLRMFRKDLPNWGLFFLQSAFHDDFFRRIQGQARRRAHAQG